MKHLDDATFERLLSGRPVSVEDRRHLDGCPVCHRGLDGVRRALDDNLRNLTEQEPDWDAQWQAIMDQLPSASITPIGRTRRGSHRLMAAAATLFVAIGIGWMIRSGGDLSAPTPTAPVPVEEILATAETLLADDGIPGFGLIDPFADTEVDFDLLLDGESS